MLLKLISFEWRKIMASQHVITLEDPAGLLITPEMLEQIGVSTGDQIEISVSGRTLIVRSLTMAETERRKTATSKDAEASADESTVTFRELINEEMDAKGVRWAEWVEVTLADGRKLRFHHEREPGLDEVVKRADIRGVTLSGGSIGGAPTVDDEREFLELASYVVEKNAELYRRLA
jgi:antitoxin component of MazEF toxin-antitoxin module